MSIWSSIKGVFVSEEPAPVELPTSHDIMFAETERAQLQASLGYPELDQNGEDPTAQVIYARVLKEAHGYTYEVARNGVAFIRQAYHPDKPGDEPMTEDEARELSQRAVERMKGA